MTKPTFSKSMRKGIYGFTNGRTQQPSADRRADRRRKNKVAKQSRKANR